MPIPIEPLIILVPLAYLTVAVYVLVLVTRLVKAVERIADKLGSTSQ
jgi:hypothetical protein